MFIVDTFWVQFGGLAPAEFISKLGKRAMMVHFKDYYINAKKGFTVKVCEVGEGNLNWDKIINACEEAGCEYALVEQDDCYGENPFDCLKRSFNYLKAMGLK